jgi:uncharacterized protein (TIGR03435 family)
MARAIWNGLLAMTLALAMPQRALAQASLPGAQTLVPATAPPATPAGKSTAKPPVYEVSSIRLNNEGGWHQRWEATPDSVIYENLSISNLILAAYGTGHPTDEQVIGIPGWAKDKRYNLTAKASAEDVDRLKGLKYKERQAMLAAVLEERFNLKVHHEMRDMPHYALRVAKSGVKMNLAAPKAPNKDAATPDQTDEGTMHQNSNGRTTHSEWHAYTMQKFTETMTWELWQINRQIVDETGLTGKYDFTLDWSIDLDGDDAAPSAPGIFAAVQSQLGLKLEMVKDQLDCVIVDHVEEPTAN